MSATETLLPTPTGRDNLLKKLRKLIRRNEHVVMATRAFRSVVHFGPWRSLAFAAIRKLRPVRAKLNDGTQPDVFLGGASEREVVRSVERDGYCVAGPLPSEIVHAIREVTDSLPVGLYTNAHEACPAVAEVVTHDAVIGILRRYFRSEPALLECGIVVADVGDTTVFDTNSFFHFDIAGWQSLNMFVHLTDVTGVNAPHVVIRGTHGGKSLRDSSRPCISNEEATLRFGDEIKTLVGPAGTMIFENTEAFHRRGEVGGRRVIINVLYSSHRGALSHGRGRRSLAKYLERTRETARIPVGPPPGQATAVEIRENVAV